MTHLPRQHADLLDEAVLSKLHAQTGVTLLAKDGTFNDYSAVLPRYFPLVTEALAAFYRAALGHMCVAHGIRVADVTAFKVICCPACRRIRHTIYACSLFVLGGMPELNRRAITPTHATRCGKPAKYARDCASKPKVRARVLLG